MVIKVGINGFGRIGRIMFRTCFQNSDIEVAAINDPAIDVEYICYLIKFDSVHGNFIGNVSSLNGDININGNTIKVYRAKEPSEIPWNAANVQYVIESSGMFTNFEKAVGHLSVEGVRRVLITAPSSDVPMIIQGVNDDKMHPDQKVISCASSTLYCLAPIMKVLESNFGVSEGFVTSIHAMTPSLKPLDGLCLRGKHWRDYRSIHQNIIPAMTGACKALGKIVPQLKDKLIGLAFRVPIVNVSVLDLTIRLNRDTTFQNIVKCVEEASKTYLKGVIDVSNEEAVSSDFIRDSHSSILDVNSSMQLRPNFYKLICWYENEYSYACRVVDSIISSERQYCQAKIIKGMKVNTELLGDHQLTHAIDKSLGSGYSSKPLSDMLRNFSKNLDFKIKSQCSPLNRNVPLVTQISVISQEADLNFDSNNQSDIRNLSSKDISLDKPCSEQIDKSLLKISSKLRTVVPNETANKRICLDEVKTDFNNMLNITEELIKKSNELYLNETSEKKVEKNNSQEQKLAQNNTNITTTTIDTNISADCNSCDSCNCAECFLDDNKKLVKSQIKKSPMGITLTVKHNFDKTRIETGLPNIESEEIDEFNVKTLYDSDTEEEPATLERGILMPKVAATNLQQGESRITDDWQINCYKIKDCFLKKKQEIKEKIYKKDSETSKLDTVVNFGDNIKVVNPVGNSCMENKTEYLPFEKTGDSNTRVDSEYKNKKNLGKQIMDKQNISVQKHVICENLALRLNSLKVSKRDIHKKKVDIYDKLDSTSATNSENSFHVKEKQSQVIYINDLTNSLEDLGRLEKICKIIEISDELSDELFSTLQAKDAAGLEHRKWSFKDLCEEIKLDDFCERVFHK